MDPRLEFAIETAYLAGQQTLSQFQTGIQAKTKENNTPVTEADLAAEALIRSRISQKYPGEAILGEEEGETGTGDTRWVVDPIDGTKSFVAGVPLYANLISCEVDGIPILGVCYLPAIGEMVYASHGNGTYLNGRRCHVSNRSELKGGIVACGGHTTMVRKGRAERFFERIVPIAMATRTWGDAFGHTLVATGRIDAMVDPEVSRWDISAMAVIVTEAGGAFTDFKGQPGIFGEALSSNGKTHAELVAAFN